MITTTINGALHEHHDTKDHWIYLARDGDVVFYIGLSNSPLYRLKQHLGLEMPYSPDEFGIVIINNLPASREWVFEIYTLEECLSVVAEFQPHVRVWYENLLGNRSYFRCLAKVAEEAFIARYKPCLNILGAGWYNKQLPERYVPYNAIANEGVII